MANTFDIGLLYFIFLSCPCRQGADDKGHATISCDACSANIGSMSIDFHGGARFVIMGNMRWLRITFKVAAWLLYSHSTMYS